MKTSQTLIICMTILLIVLGITFAIWFYQSNENPYEQCLDRCDNVMSIKMDCIENCNEVFKEVALDFFDKAENIINEILEERK